MKYILSLLLLLFQCVHAQEVTVVSDKGESISLDVSSYLPLQHIFNEASDYFANSGEQFDVYIANVHMQNHSLSASVGRNYDQPPTEQQKQDISYIVKTLGSASMPSLLKNKSSLKKAGDRIDQVHPLRFLEVLFSTEELKAAAHAVRKRTTFVWGEFFDGLKNSLEEESRRNNMTDAQIIDFSHRVGIDPNKIRGAIQQHQWQQFYDILIREIPRQGNPGKYNM